MKVLKWTGIVLTLLVILFFGLSLTLGTMPEEDFMSSRLDEIERCFIHRDVSNKEVSQVDVAWQLDHILKAINNIATKLEASDREDYQLNFNATRTVVFLAGDFPRGVAQAPPSVVPPEVITDKSLMQQLILAREKVISIQSLHKRSSFLHETFGLLDRDESARLLEIHTDHHLKIIRDILEAEGIESN